MLLLIFFLACLFIAVGTGLLAAWSDFKGLTIPNLYSAVIIGACVTAYAVLWLLGHADVFYGLFAHLAGVLLVFGATAVLFAIGAIGAADSKLGTAFAFWIGLPALPLYLFYVTIFGGLLGIAALALKKWKPVKNPPAGSWIARVQAGESKVPYGIAITAGALASFAKLGYFNESVLGSFLVS